MTCDLWPMACLITHELVFMVRYLPTKFELGQTYVRSKEENPPPLPFFATHSHTHTSWHFSCGVNYNLISLWSMRWITKPQNLLWDLHAQPSRIFCWFALPSRISFSIRCICYSFFHISIFPDINPTNIAKLLSSIRDRDWKNFLLHTMHRVWFLHKR